MSNLLTTGEVALLLKVSTKTVGRWAKKGLLHPIVINASTHRYRSDDVQALLDSHIICDSGRLDKTALSLPPSHAQTSR